MVTPASISPGVYTALDTAATIADTTTSSVAAGRKVIAVVSWYGSQTLSSVSGGGLTWTVHGQTSGSEYKMAYASADAPAGLASGVTITATLSGSAFARSLNLSSCDGLELNTNAPVDGSNFPAPAFLDSAWSVAVTTANATDVLFGAAWVTFLAPSGMAATAPATEVYEWADSDNGVHQRVYTELSSTGSQTIGGTFTATKTLVAAAIAFKTAAPVDPHEGSAAGTFAFVGASSGARTSSGSATGAVTWAGAVVDSASTPASRTRIVAAEPRVMLVPAESRTAGATMPSLFTKDPSEVLDYAQDWNDVLEEGETITDSTWAVGSGITQTTPAPSVTEGVATIWLSGGTEAHRYALTNHITTSEARQYERTFWVELRSR